MLLIISSLTDLLEILKQLSRMNKKRNSTVNFIHMRTGCYNNALVLSPVPILILVKCIFPNH